MPRSHSRACSKSHSEIILTAGEMHGSQPTHSRKSMKDRPKKASHHRKLALTTNDTNDIPLSKRIEWKERKKIIENT